MFDFHNHLLPGVDDGATDLDESRAALLEMHAQGVRTLIVTPHLTAGLTGRAPELAAALERFDAAFDSLLSVAAAETPGLRLERGVELMLDLPNPDLSDPRVRLAGTRFLLVEFPGLMIPPHGVQALYELALRGWRPVVAHPERYRNLEDVDLVDDWRSVGAYVQVNSGSLLGRYGDRAKKTAWDLLSRGWVDYLSSDYHARGRLPVAECAALLRRSRGEEQLRMLTEQNPARMLAGEDPLPVPPLQDPPSLWRRLLRVG